jgi:hypothetical protein
MTVWSRGHRSIVGSSKLSSLWGDGAGVSRSARGLLPHLTAGATRPIQLAARPVLLSVRQGPVIGISTIVCVRGLCPALPSLRKCLRACSWLEHGRRVDRIPGCRCHPANSPLASCDTLGRLVDCGSRQTGLAMLLVPARMC